MGKYVLRLGKQNQVQELPSHSTAQKAAIHPCTKQRGKVFYSGLDNLWNIRMLFQILLAWKPGWQAPQQSDFYFLFFSFWLVFQCFLFLAGMEIPQEWSSLSIPELSLPVPPQARVCRSMRKRQTKKHCLMAWQPGAPRCACCLQGSVAVGAASYLSGSKLLFNQQTIELGHMDMHF